MPDEKYIHDTEHDSKTDPVPGCPHCRYEVQRRQNRCYGDGMSSVRAPQKENE